MSRRNYHVEYRGDGTEDYDAHYFGRESRSAYNSLPKVELMVVMMVVILTALCLFVLIFATLHLFLLLRLPSLSMRYASMRARLV